MCWNIKFPFTLHWHSMKHWNRIYWHTHFRQKLVNFLRGDRGGSAPVHAGIPPLGADTPLGPGTPGADTHPQSSHPNPLRTRHTPPEQCMLGDTGNKRVVRILLECILVLWGNFTSVIRNFTGAMLFNSTCANSIKLTPSCSLVVGDSRAPPWYLFLL